MEHGTTLIAIVHIIIAFFLVVIVLLQDSKGGGMGGSFGGGSNQSIFGATGATSFLVKVTRFLAIGFMTTCIILTVVSAHKSSKSVIDSVVAKPATSQPLTPSTPVVPPQTPPK